VVAKLLKLAIKSCSPKENITRRDVESAQLNRCKAEAIKAGID
jgi:hypothetical protein